MAGLVDWFFDLVEKVAFRIIDAKRDALVKGIDDDPIIKRKRKEFEEAQEKLEKTKARAKLSKKNPDATDK